MAPSFFMDISFCSNISNQSAPTESPKRLLMALPCTVAREAWCTFGQVGPQHLIVPGDVGLLWVPIESL